MAINTISEFSSDIIRVLYNLCSTEPGLNFYCGLAEQKIQEQDYVQKIRFIFDAVMSKQRGKPPFTFENLLSDPSNLKNLEVIAAKTAPLEAQDAVTVFNEVILKCPEAEEFSDSIKSLDIYKKAQAIQGWIDKNPHVFQNIISLSLSNKELTFLPSWIGNLNSLKRLIITENHLFLLPKEFSNLKELTYLRLSVNAFTDFPMPVCSLSQLVTLDLSHNQLEHLPQEIQSLVDLEDLDLGSNKFSSDELDKVTEMLAPLQLTREGEIWYDDTDPCSIQ